VSEATIWRTAAGRVRAPWQVLLFVVMVIAASSLFGGLAYALLSLTPAIDWARDLRIPLDQVLFLGSILVATVMTGRMLRPEESAWSYVALDANAWQPRKLGAASLVGTLVVAIPVLLLLALGAVRFVPASATDSGLVAAWTGVALLAPAALSEELLFRGFAFSAMRESVGATRAITITSFFFGLVHILNPEPSVIATVGVAVAGVFLAVVRLAMDSLAAAFVAHFWVNYTQATIFHAPVSSLALPTPGYRLESAGPDWITGGSWGPEGGVAVIAAMLLASFLMKRKTDDRGQKTVRK
jgi:membrane protease YdiL (CAAX protease family)